MSFFDKGLIIAAFLLLSITLTEAETELADGESEDYYELYEYVDGEEYEEAINSNNNNDDNDDAALESGRLHSLKRAIPLHRNNNNNNNNGWVPSTVFVHPHGHHRAVIPQRPLFVPHSHNHHDHQPVPKLPKVVQHHQPSYQTPKTTVAPVIHHHHPQPVYQPQPPPPLTSTSTTSTSTTSQTVDSAEVETERPLQFRDYFPPPNIVALLEDEGATTLLSLLEQADLLDTLEGRGQFTLFAPKNEAFSKLDRETIQNLADDRDLLRSVLRYHLVDGGKIFAMVIKDDLVAPTALEGASLRFNRVTFDNLDGDIVTVNGAEMDLGMSDQRASNGVVHFVESLVYPIPTGSIYETLENDNRFITLVRALEVADLVDTLNATRGPYTILAPTEEAFELIPREALNDLLDDQEALSSLLLKHVIRGTKLSAALSFADVESVSGQVLKIRTNRGQVLVNGEARILDGDLMANNGAIQIIDRVLL